MALVGGEGSNFMWRKKVTAAKLGVHGNDKTEKNHLAVVGKQPPPPLYAVSHGYGGRGDLALGLLQLVGKGKLGRLLLQLGDLVQGGLDELALHVTDRDGELIDLEVAEDDLVLQEEHLALKAVPLVEVLLADLLQVVHGGVVKVGFGATPLGDHP